MRPPQLKRSRGGDSVRSDQMIMSDWANLPEHLLDSVSDRLLSSSDYIRFSAVCMSWFGVGKYNQSHHRNHPQPPMLLFFNDKEDAWSLYNVIENKVIEDLLFRLPNKRFCGSAYGWLVLVEQDFTVTLIKPSPNSKDRAGRENLVIRLPQLNPPEHSEERRKSWVKNCNYYVLKATITADPILNTDECVVVLSYVEQCQMAFIRLGKDTTWTYLRTKGNAIVDIVQREDGKFYAVCFHGNLLKFDVTSESNLVVKSLECGIGRNSNCIRKYLVESNGKDLLMVVRACHWDDRTEIHVRSTIEFKVYKFDFNRCLWIEKETLGDDVAIFIGENQSICVAASNYPGCKQNCIYFNHDFDFICNIDMLNDFGVYNMETKSISKPYSKHLLSLLEMVNHRPIWFTPTLRL